MKFTFDKLVKLEYNTCIEIEKSLNTLANW